MNDPFQQYRSNKQFDSDSESETEGANASTSAAINMAFHPDQIKAVVQAAINHALQEAAADGQRREDQLRQTIQELANQVAAIQIAPAQAVAPQIKVYAPIDINRDIVCNEPLDAVKCLPEFAGTQET